MTFPLSLPVPAAKAAWVNNDSLLASCKWWALSSFLPVVRIEGKLEEWRILGVSASRWKEGHKSFIELLLYARSSAKTSTCIISFILQEPHMLFVHDYLHLMEKLCLLPKIILAQYPLHPLSQQYQPLNSQQGTFIWVPFVYGLCDG